MDHHISQGIIGALIAFFVILAFQTILIRTVSKRAKKNSKREIRFMDLIITCEDELYSLSRLQMYLWTIVIIIGFSAVFMANNSCPNIPPTLYLLMGISFAASVTSTAITTIKDTPGEDKLLKDRKKKPEFFRDIFFEANDSLDLPRTQMFIWTVITIIAFVVMVINSFYNLKPELPDIPMGLVALMGLSQGAYLGSKAAVKKDVVCSQEQPSSLKE